MVFQGLAGLARSQATLSGEGKKLILGPTSNIVTSCQVTSKTIKTLCTGLSRTGRKTGLQLYPRSLVAPRGPADFQFFLLVDFWAQEGLGNYPEPRGDALTEFGPKRAHLDPIQVHFYSF